LFLFPLFAVSIRHWASIIFLLLSSLALATLRRNATKLSLTGQERCFLLAAGTFFITFILSSAWNGWDSGSWRLLERELRYLLFIPLYLLLRKTIDPLGALGAGCVLAVILNFFIVIYQVFWLGLTGDPGVYGPLFTGPVSVLLAIVALTTTCKVRNQSVSKYLHFALLGLTAIIAALCGRSSMLGYVALIILWITFVYRRPKSLLIILPLTLGVVLIWDLQAWSVTPKLSRGWIEFKDYMNVLTANADMRETAVKTSVGTRLEMLRSVYYVFIDSPWWGIGGYNYQYVINSYIEKGFIAESLRSANHPHNVFAEVIISKGLVGLLVFTVFLYSALHCFAVSLIRNREIAIAGITFTACVLLVMLTESAIVVKGNFIAVFLLMLGVLLAQINSNDAKR